MILPYIENIAGNAEEPLAPFRTTLKPVFEHVGVVSSYNAAAHGADSLANIPLRSVTGGAMFSELWDDVVIKVFGEWVAFTESEDHKGTMVLWEFGAREKFAEVTQAVTAFPVRNPHDYVTITGRFVGPPKPFLIPLMYFERYTFPSRVRRPCSRMVI
jgi:hypothetical protein